MSVIRDGGEQPVHKVECAGSMVIGTATSFLALVIPVGAATIVLFKIPVAGMDIGDPIRITMLAVVLVVPAGVAAIVRKIIGMIAAGMEHGINRKITVPAVVTVNPTGEAAIVRKINRMLVVGMDFGLNRTVQVALVPVKMVGAAVIAQNHPGRPVSITGYGMQIQAISMADSVIVMMVTPVRIVRLLIKNRNRCLKKGDPWVAFRMFYYKFW